jgi:hypothetical protein
MSTLTTTHNANPLQYLMSGLFALLLLAATAVPAQAQMEDDELPSIDFAVNLMQSAQAIGVDNAPGANSGFHRVRVGLNASVQFSENVSGLLMLEQEPNDFGGIGGQQFSPQVDFAIMDLALSDQITFRAGTPVTGLMNFRGFSDGPVTQGNPMIGNSLADMITAGQGVKLIGSFDSFGFDITLNRGFGESITTLNETNTGLNYIGKFRFTGSETVQFGGGVAFQSGTQGLVFSAGDGENYNVANGGGAAAARNTHAQLPNETIVHADAKVTPGNADFDLWGGYATGDDLSPGSGINYDDFEAFFGGVGAKYNLTDAFYAAGRFSFASDQSDAVEDFDDTSLTRFQVGLGVEVYEQALLKVEYVNQTETAPGGQAGTELSGVGNDWDGVTAELSFAF